MSLLKYDTFLLRSGQKISNFRRDKGPADQALLLVPKMTSPNERFSELGLAQFYDQKTRNTHTTFHMNMCKKLNSDINF